MAFHLPPAGGSPPGWDSQILRNDKKSLGHQTPAGSLALALPSWRNVLPCGEAVLGSEWPCISKGAKWLPSLPPVQLPSPPVHPMRFCF